MRTGGARVQLNRALAAAQTILRISDIGQRERDVAQNQGIVGVQSESPVGAIAYAMNFGSIVGVTAK